MRICYFADGRSIHTQRWMRYFSGQGHEMYLLSYAPMSDENIAAMKAIGVKVLGTVGNFHVKKFWLTLRDLKFIKSVLNQEKIDILHSHFLGANAWYGALSGFPHIITIMGGDVMGENWKPAKNLQERLMSPLALKRASVVTAWSRPLADKVRPFVTDGANIPVVHGGVELDKFVGKKDSALLRQDLNIPVGGKIIFSPRLIRQLYNIDKIAEAANLVCSARPDTYFIMALPELILDHEYIDAIKAIFFEGAARDYVRFIPSIEHHRIADYFDLADVAVSIPSSDGTPMTVLESMACGTPTVIGNLADYDKEYFEHETTTLMVDVKDPQSIADAIIRYFTEAGMARRIADEAQRRVEETGSYETQMNKMNEIYLSFSQ